jgi:hypothetical protein
MKHLYFLILIVFVSCRSNKSILTKNVDIEVYTYENEGKIQASAMPKLRSESKLNEYNRRFEYLLINVPEIHFPQKAERRKEIWDLYPDTTKLKKLYLNEYVQDEKLTNYFELTKAAIWNENFEATITFTIDELLEVASKFFYCDKVFPDSTIQSHVCIGLNGISEANWTKDYKLLEAFCYEAIFNDLDKDISEIDESYSFEKKEACQKYESMIVTLDLYLEDVRNELFARMQNNPVLRTELLEYYEHNKSNLAFKIMN